MPSLFQYLNKYRMFKDHPPPPPRSCFCPPAGQRSSPVIYEIGHDIELIQSYIFYSASGVSHTLILASNMKFNVY